MVKTIHRVFGTEMWVADDRVEEYKAAGHKLAAPAEMPADPPKKTARRKKGS